MRVHRAMGLRRRVVASIVGTVTVVALALGGSTGAAAAPRPAAGPAGQLTVDDAVLTWAVNQEVGSGAFFGGCNFLVAGRSGNAGSSHVWTPDDAAALYRTEMGAVVVEKPDLAGAYHQPTWATKCLTASGEAADAGSTAESDATGNRVRISGGTGTVDPATGTATVAWEGSFTVVFYGGLTYWSATDPVLTVAADGSGTLTATASGYGTDMADPTRWVALEEESITLARLSSVDLGTYGLTVTPDYLGVGVDAPAQPQAAKAADNEEYWGAFPQDFVDYQVLTGQAPYWYSSGGARDAAKPTAPLSISYNAAPQLTTQPASKSVTVGTQHTFAVKAAGPDLSYQWQRAAPGSSTFAAIGGAVTPSLTVKPTTTASSGTRFRVVISNANGSVTSTAATLTVVKATPKLTVTAPAAVTYGQKATLKATATISGGTVTGTVTVKTASGKTVGTGRLSGGRVSIVLAGTALPAGTRPLTVRTSGDATTVPVAKQVTLKVTKAKAKVAASVASSSIPRSGSASVTVRVSVSGVVPTGTVAIKAGATGTTTVKKVTLSTAHKGVVKVTLPRLKPGSHRIVAVYAGTADIVGATAPAARLTVRTT